MRGPAFDLLCAFLALVFAGRAADQWEAHGVGAGLLSLLGVMILVEVVGWVIDEL